MKHSPGKWEAELVGNTSAGDNGREVYEITNGYQRIAEYVEEQDANLIAAAPELLAALIRAIEGAGFYVSGPCDPRAAENGEPAWVCNARAVIAEATK